MRKNNSLILILCLWLFSGLHLNAQVASEQLDVKLPKMMFIELPQRAPMSTVSEVEVFLKKTTKELANGTEMYYAGYAAQERAHAVFSSAQVLDMYPVDAYYEIKQKVMKQYPKATFKIVYYADGYKMLHP